MGIRVKHTRCFRVRRASRLPAVFLRCATVAVIGGLLLLGHFGWDSSSAHAGARDVSPDLPGGISWTDFFSARVVFTLILLMLVSAFFSSTESAFMSIPKPRLRALREEGSLSGRLVAQMLDHPGRFLTTVLVGNTLVNIIIGVVLGTRMKDMLEICFQVRPAAAYAAAIGVGTGALVILGDVIPKIFAVRTREHYARIAIFPLLAADALVAPIRDGLLWVTDQLFRITRFHELRAAPYITDEELSAMLAKTEAHPQVEEDGRQMIRRILEFNDLQLREILVPRPDVVALPEDATVAEALQTYREYEYSRLPVYRDDLDHVTGILFAKDLIAPLFRGETDKPVKRLARPPHFVPETMSVQRFVKDVQRLRSHLAVVVDEYGGTEGIVTLHDAVEQVVGDIRDEFDEDAPAYEIIDKGIYRVHGSFSLGDLEDLIGRDLGETEHQTVAGLLMDQSEKVPEAGDRISYLGITFQVEQVKGKRASWVRIEIPEPREEEDD